MTGDGPTLEIDWDGDGDYDDAGEDVTARFKARPGVSVGYGRDQVRAGSPARVGTLSLDLNNVSRDYSPENTASPLHGLIRPSRRLRWTYTHLGVDHLLFAGRLDDYVVNPDPNTRTVSLTAVDALARLRGQTVSLSLLGARTGEAIEHVAHLAGWDSDYDLDPGATIVPRLHATRIDAWDLIQQLVDSEGPPALITVDSDGRLVFRDRHHRLLRAASTTSQATLRDAGLEPLHSTPMGYDIGWKDVVNRVEYTADIRMPVGVQSTAWSAPGIHTIPAGGALILRGDTNSSYHHDGLIYLTEGVDYQVVSGEVDAAFAQIRGDTITVSLTASVATIVNDLTVSAYALQTLTTVRVEAEDATSIDQYGPRALRDGRSPVHASPEDQKALAEVILGTRAERRPTVSVTLRGGNNIRLTQQLTRALSDRVTIIDAETGLDGDFHVEQIAHHYDGQILVTTFGCEKAPQVAADVLILDDAVAGLLDTGTLATSGLSDPDTVLILDTSLLDAGVLGY